MNKIRKEQAIRRRSVFFAFESVADVSRPLWLEHYTRYKTASLRHKRTLTIGPLDGSFTAHNADDTAGQERTWRERERERGNERHDFLASVRSVNVAQYILLGKLRKRRAL